MRRVALILLVLAGAVAFVLPTAGAGDDGSSYKVRAIFDNAAFVIPGEDVKVAGVKVGSISAVDVTPQFKAAVTLDITDPAYQDFRRDAECIVRPQSLIGEKFVECVPTGARAAGEQLPPELPKDSDGVRELPVTNTMRSVDLDLVNNVMRRPYRERLTLVLNELGVGLAGRGGDLNEVIRRANPALKELSKVLNILASQNQVLRGLAKDSDTVLAPLARERKHVAGFIRNAGGVARATAERRAQLEQDIQKLPAFLRELKPTMVRLGALSDDMTPVLSDLGDVAPDINRFLLELGPFSRAATPALDTLGDAGKVGIPALKAAQPTIKDLGVFAQRVRPVGKSLNEILTSVKKGRGFERLMDYIFYQVAAINGYDSFGHYLRAGLIVNQCSSYATVASVGCEATFQHGSATASKAGASRATAGNGILDITRALLGGAKLDDLVDKQTQASNRRAVERALTEPRKVPMPSQGQGQGTQQPAPGGSPIDPTGPLLDYLFGSDR